MEQDFRLVIEPNTYISYYIDKRTQAKLVLDRFIGYVSHRANFAAWDAIFKIHHVIRPVNDPLGFNPNMVGNPIDYLASLNEQ